jgi:prophage antirepressor-like protein
VCGVLGLSNPTSIADRLDDDEKGVSITDTLGDDEKDILKTKSDLVLDIPNRGLAIVNESGLYNVIIRSDKPEAKNFKRWIAHEVLPSIRLCSP